MNEGPPGSMSAVDRCITSSVRVVALAIITNNWLFAVTVAATNTSHLTTDKQRTTDRNDVIARSDDVTFFAEVTSDELVSDSYNVKFASEYNDVTIQPDPHNKSSDSPADYMYVDDVSDNYVNSDVDNGDVMGELADSDTDDDSVISYRQVVMGDSKQVDDGDNNELTMKAYNETDTGENYPQGFEIGDSHPGAAEFRNFDSHLTRPLSRHQIGLRWLQQNHFDMRTVTYVWLGFLLTVLCVVCMTTAFKNRHLVTSAIQYTRTHYVRRRERWHNTTVDLRDESNTLLGHAQV